MRIIRGHTDLAMWCEQAGSDVDEPFTYVIDADRVLRPAPRRSEHVACAQGSDVLAAGEIAFTKVGGVWQLSLVSNLSTGYCPDLGFWSAVTAALAGAAIAHPEALTDAIVFRRCPVCGERNLVKEQAYVCATCDAPLPTRWNFDTAAALGTPREAAHR